jgi:maltose phosphorylase
VRLGLVDKAHEMLLRTARLDLDDLNNDTRDGCHTTSMAGTWIAAVLGFGGVHVIDGELNINPTLAPGWTSLGFQLQFRGAWLSVSAAPTSVTIENRSETAASIRVAGERHDIAAGAAITVTVA